MNYAARFAGISTFGFSGSQRFEERHDREILTYSNRWRAGEIASLIEEDRAIVRIRWTSASGAPQTMAFLNPLVRWFLEYRYPYRRDTRATCQALADLLRSSPRLRDLAEMDGITLEGLDETIDRMNEKSEGWDA